MKKFLKVIICLVMALTLVGTSACGLFGGGNGGNENGKTYTVTLNLNGGELLAWEEVNSYTAGTVVELPTPTKADSTFAGWYESSEFSGSRVTKIYASDTGNKTYWAKWTSGGNTTNPSDPSNPSNPTTPSNPTPPSVTGTLTLSACEGYNEGALVEFDKQSGVSTYTVSYAKGNSSTYTKIDSQLIRENGNKVRADIVGLSAGTYSIKVEAGDKSALASNVQVTAYDRSGYAHFGKSDGVGAYKDDGTPKDGANIVYVTEATKNSVKATIDGKSYTGIVSILQHAGTKTPLIVRVIGTVGAATWEKGKIDYNKDNKYSAKNKMADSVVVGINGKGLERKNWDQEDLITGGYNVLDESVYKKLNGLNSKIKWDGSSDKMEYDSCWNDCSISGVKNVTVEGIGKDARIFQWGMTFKNCNSIEVRNLTFEDYTEDACSFEGGKTSASSLSDFTSKNFWVHHNVFEEGVNYWDVCSEQDKHDGDGSTDFKGLSNVTISYNVYNGTHKTGLIGGSDSQSTASITFHHNAYNACKSRLPMARQANMHMYNNYYNGTTSCALSLRAGAYALVENCYFNTKSGATSIDLQTHSTYKDGAAKVIGCVIDSKQITNKGNENHLYVGTDRLKTVTNDNKFSKTFDTDASVFYYDSTSKVSKVTVMHTAEETKTLVPQLAGVLKK